MSDFLGIAHACLLPKHRLINLFEFSHQSKNSNLFTENYQRNLDQKDSFTLQRFYYRKLFNKFWLKRFFWTFFLCYFNPYTNLSKLMCFNKRNQFAFWQKINLNFVFWLVKSSKFICIFVLTGKIQQIDLNFCSDVQCLKSQTFSNSCAKNRLESRRNQTRRGNWVSKGTHALSIKYKRRSKNIVLDP